MKTTRSFFVEPELEFVSLPSCDMIRTSGGGHSGGSGGDSGGDSIDLKPIPIPRW